MEQPLIYATCGVCCTNDAENSRENDFMTEEWLIWNKTSIKSQRQVKCRRVGGLVGLFSGQKTIIFWKMS
jgi:hypothetical protein